MIEWKPQPGPQTDFMMEPIAKTFLMQHRIIIHERAHAWVQFRLSMEALNRSSAQATKAFDRWKFIGVDWARQVSRPSRGWARHVRRQKAIARRARR